MMEPGRPGGMEDDADVDAGAFADRIADPLRAQESLDATFEVRVMSAVHAEARLRRSRDTRPRFAAFEWLLRPRLVRLAPLHALAAVAVCVSLTLLGRHVVGVLGGARTDVVGEHAPVDTVHVVRFVLISPAAESVSLVGDFNAWEKGATRLSADANGAWVASIPLPAGRHEYAFIVEGPEGEQWVADPYARTVQDEFDTQSSVITVGSAGAGAADRVSS